ncbi:hypothetical protein ACUNHR_24730 [Serratia sp. IR-2025]|uniref:hypothetical protein n=1 Tax=Serratia bockelmannii TaxID=2703793 RepID=UPI00313EB5AD
MKNTSGDLKGKSMKRTIFACLLMIPCASQAKSVYEKPITEQCKLAISESNEAAELLNSFLTRWLSGDSDILDINSAEFDQYKKSHFDTSYKAIEGRFKVTDTATLEQLNTSPILRSNDITLRTRFIVNAFQQLVRDKDKDKFRNSYKPLKAAIIENEAFIKKTCSNKK